MIGEDTAIQQHRRDALERSLNPTLPPGPEKRVARSWRDSQATIATNDSRQSWLFEDWGRDGASGVTNPSTTANRESVISVAQSPIVAFTSSFLRGAEVSEHPATHMHVPPPPGEQPGLEAVRTIVSDGSDAPMHVPPPREEQPGLEPVPMIVPDGSDGLIPVEPSPGTTSGGEEPVRPIRQPNCQIRPDASFYQFKGFCAGAREVLSGGPGVKKVKKVVC